MLDTDNIPTDSDSDSDSDLDVFSFSFIYSALHICNGVRWGYGEAERVDAWP